jgi:hypothetical protein
VAKAEPGRRRRGRRPASLPAGAADGFYRSALSEAERLALAEAAEMHGLDDEIAVLRVKLRTALEENPQDVKLMFKGLELLVKALAARYRLTQRAEDELSERVEAVLRDLGGPLYPEVFGDAA